MNAITFVLSDLDTGRTLGRALVCVNARYASIAWRGAERLDRVFVRPHEWKGIEMAIAEKLPAGALPAASPIVVALLPEDRRHSIVIQYYTQQPIQADAFDVVAAQLDGLLARSAVRA
jgi:hypothetical protein